MNKSIQKSKADKMCLHEIEIVYKGPVVSKSPKISSSMDVVQVFRAFTDERKLDYKEKFNVILLNKANICIGISNIGVGTTDAVPVNIKEILQLGLMLNACGIIVMHNHPSGNLKPSDSDIKLTKKLKQVCVCIEIQLLDCMLIETKTLQTIGKLYRLLILFLYL
jgi:DNA repair protein RadC